MILVHSALPLPLIIDKCASPAIVGDVVGHDSEAIQRNDTKVDIETKRQALDKLPDLIGWCILWVTGFTRQQKWRSSLIWDRPHGVVYFRKLQLAQHYLFVHHSLMLNTTISHYKITAKLGQGGMGEVYRATDTKLDREVAIKVLPQSVAQNKERLARFEREAKMLAQLNHPNIEAVHGFDQHEGIWFLVMECFEAEDLSSILKKGSIPVEDAHEKDIIHRDLKPWNIKVDADGRIKVLDFGLAKALSDESNLNSVSTRSPCDAMVFTQIKMIILKTRVTT